MGCTTRMAVGLAVVALCAQGCGGGGGTREPGGGLGNGNVLKGFMASEIELDPETGLQRIADRVVVRAGAGKSPSDMNGTAREHGCRLVSQLPKLGLYEFEVVDGTDPDAKKRTLEGDSAVRGAFQDVLLPNACRPPDAPGPSGAGGLPVAEVGALEFRPSEGRVFYSEPNVWNYERIGAFETWSITTGRRSITIGVVDTGVRRTHTDLAPKLRKTWAPWWANPDTDEDGHGTMVCGLAGAAFNNGEGIAGLGGHSRIASYKCPHPMIYLFECCWALEAAATDGCEVVNLSIGFPDVWNESLRDFYRVSLYENYLKPAVDKALSSGCVLIAAVGPHAGAARDVDQQPVYPASDARVLAVGATWIDPTGTEKYFLSNYGQDVIAVPSVLTTTSRGGDNAYREHAYGSSLAAPLVAGTAALVRATDPGLSNVDTMAIILDSADAISAKWPDGRAIRRLNVHEAVLRASGGRPPEITALTASRQEVAPGQDVDFTCTAIDVDGDPLELEYHWTYTGGSIVSSGPRVTWTAPNAPGRCTITCTVRDPGGLSDSRSVGITVTSTTIIIK